jgi:hypothetical protein
MLRGRGPSGGPGVLLEGIWKFDAAGVEPCRAGARSVVGSDEAPRQHYRSCIKSQGSNHIKIEKKQIDRAMVAHGGDDHNHGALCAPEVEKGKKEA